MITPSGATGWVSERYSWHYAQSGFFLEKVKGRWKISGFELLD